MDGAQWRAEHWGTVIVVDTVEPLPAQAVDELTAWFVRVDRLFSTWRDDSEIMGLAAGTLALADADPDVRLVLARCEQHRERSGGAFDVAAAAHPDTPPAPGRAPIDPSGFVKGWAVERAAALLADRGIDRLSINAGGDLVTRGLAPSGRPWRIGIRHPWIADRVAAVLELGDAAVATSGRYERGDHVLVPSTGQPATGLMSVTVVGDDLGNCDAEATAVLVMGRAGMDWIVRRPGAAAMAVTDDGEVLVTPAFERYRVG